MHMDMGHILMPMVRKNGESGRMVKDMANTSTENTLPEDLSRTTVCPCVHRRMLSRTTFISFAVISRSRVCGVVNLNTQVGTCSEAIFSGTMLEYPAAS